MAIILLESPSPGGSGLEVAMQTRIFVVRSSRINCTSLPSFQLLAFWDTHCGRARVPLVFRRCRNHTLVVRKVLPGRGEPGQPSFMLANLRLQPRSFGLLTVPPPL